ncbi:MgtC/SapB family protein [Rhodoplanes serenus]|uniref:MgtC/SapB family protein n=1 Tax=Rhodoplanes serenus TaxID=200615 RepID=UPI000DAC834B|nr:DUF4010 domain-containing protein [Rhodoplanes serenus]RAI30384.1 hypothetical protein CH340_21720 [Rhodoplanes serenus]
MAIDDLLARFALALGIGLMIGLERGWRLRDDVPGSRTAGIRTFTVVAILGAVAGALGRALSAEPAAAAVVIGLVFLGFAGAFALFCHAENRADNAFSATTMVTGLVTFALGAYALVGDRQAAAAVAVAVAALLAMREALHGFVAKVTAAELRSALVLLAMTCIVLPIAPDTAVGPYGGVNPRQIWLTAIVLAAVSFVGYLAVGRLGPARGVLLAAAAGGLVSSTAVTATNARRAAAGEGSPQLLAAGVAVATAISFVRVLVIAAAVNPTLLPALAPALAGAVAAALGYAALRVAGRRADAAGAPLAFRNPFDLASVVGFALFLAGIVVLGRFLGDRLGEWGAVVGAAAVGLADVDAITVSMAQLAPATLSPAAAGHAILAAVASNTVAKVAIGAAAGGRRFAIEIAVLGLACAAAGLAGWAVTVVAGGG